VIIAGAKPVQGGVVRDIATGALLRRLRRQKMPEPVADEQRLYFNELRRQSKLVGFSDLKEAGS
jgi:hypothetical protein